MGKDKPKRKKKRKKEKETRKKEIWEEEKKKEKTKKKNLWRKKTWILGREGAFFFYPFSHLHFRDLLRWCQRGILQYTLIRPITTIVAAALLGAGYYDEGEWRAGVLPIRIKNNRNKENQTKQRL